MGCTSGSHPLYGTFMKKLSLCIFRWDPKDVEELREAKKRELINAGITDPSPSAVTKALTKHEMAQHCRRETRGTEETVDLLESLLLSLSTATDILGVPLLRSEMTDIWTEQKHHVKCLQESMQLYTVTRMMEKEG